RDAAREAIVGPIEEYNRLHTIEGQRFTIETPLVDAVLEQLQRGQLSLGEARSGVLRDPIGGTPGEIPIEAPYLQLVMTCLWEEAIRAGSRVLTLATLNRLGGVEKIVRPHLENILNKWAESDRDVAARLFLFLVTPDGTKVAHSLTNLV